MDIMKILEALHDEGLLEFPDDGKLDRAFEFIRPSKKAKEIGQRVRVRVLASMGWEEIDGKARPISEEPPPLPDPPPPSSVF